jgi:hypothetical protein
VLPITCSFEFAFEKDSMLGIQNRFLETRNYGRREWGIDA